MLKLLIPCEAPELTPAIIDNDGDMIFPDYDIETDMIAVELGDDPSFCADAFIAWNNNPLHFICASGLFPIDLTGSILALWCQEAARKARKQLKEAHCFKETVALTNECAKFWRSRRYNLKKIRQSKLDLVRAWNSYVRKVTGGYSGAQYLKSAIEHKAINAALDNYRYIQDYVTQTEMVGGVTEPIGNCSDVMANVIDVFFIKAYPGSTDISGDLMRIPEYMDEGRDYMFMLAMKEIRRYQ